MCSACLSAANFACAARFLAISPAVVVTTFLTFLAVYFGTSNAASAMTSKDFQQLKSRHVRNAALMPGTASGHMLRHLHVLSARPW